MLLALLLVLLSQPDDLSKDLRIEAIAPGFLIDLLLAFVQFADFLLDVLDAFDDGAQLIAGMSTGPPMVKSRVGSAKRISPGRGDRGLRTEGEVRGVGGCLPSNSKDRSCRWRLRRRRLLVSRHGSPRSLSWATAWSATA